MGDDRAGRQGGGHKKPKGGSVQGGAYRGRPAWVQKSRVGVQGSAGHVMWRRRRGESSVQCSVQGGYSRWQVYSAVTWEGAAALPAAWTGRRGRRAVVDRHTGGTAGRRTAQFVPGEAGCSDAKHKARTKHASTKECPTPSRRAGRPRTYVRCHCHCRLLLLSAASAVPSRCPHTPATPPPHHPRCLTGNSAGRPLRQGQWEGTEPPPGSGLCCTGRRASQARVHAGPRRSARRLVLAVSGLGPRWGVWGWVSGGS